MNLTQWYIASTVLLTGSLFLFRFGSVGLAFIVESRSGLIRNMVYRRLPRRLWQGLNGVEGGLFIGYIVFNGFCMGWGVDNIADLVPRAGMMAVLNLIPLFCGGRTSTLVDFLGISLHSYYLAHHWIGRMVVLQGLVHVVGVVVSKKPWTFDSFQVSGITVSSLYIFTITSNAK